ncbi:ABC transporter substrate-binding protein [Bacillus kwashiorkori]|uniref:ABC transporter substrate-binding protein n=1 Tax=Bacillus kwashiorkori TaxID=1522318 RepID=UPI0007804FF4|nr:extracellular solute-binding protein [Bacillus kwashiorkori]
MKWIKGIAIILLSSLLLAGCSGGDNGGKDGQVTLELFSNKSESIETYKGLIKEFENQNPNIKIKFNSPPEAETVLKTRLTKNDLPDIMSINGNATFGELGRAGVLHDFTDDDAINQVQPPYVDMLNRLVGPDADGVYGLPYATNANGVIYNKTKFEELGLSIPKTWDDFIAALDKAKAAGEKPLMFTLKDAWTGLPMWNSLSGNLVGTDFAEKKNAGETSFQESYPAVADKALQLLSYSEGDVFGVGYGDGNNAFATGDGVMYLQGNWAIPEILKANPDAQVGMFALPVTNNADENKLVSGVDVVLAINENTKHKEEAMKFVEFMLSKEIAQRYIQEQAAFSAVNDVLQEDPVFEGIKTNFENGSIASFVDHYYPAGMGAENLIQDFYINKDKNAFLKKIDNEWDKVVNR